MGGSGLSSKSNQCEQVWGGGKHRHMCAKQDLPFGWRVGAVRGVAGIQGEQGSRGGL